MVHAYLALNYLEQRRLDAARVEALQADVLLREGAQGASIRPYTEDAFTRYLTGIVYEDEREWSDAMIAYRKAYEAYQATARPVRRRAARDAQARPHSTGRPHGPRPGGRALPEILRDRGHARASTALADQGEIILTVHAGLAPAKREQAITVLNPNTGRLLRVALPQYRSRGDPFAYARVSVEYAVGHQLPGRKRRRDCDEEP